MIIIQISKSRSILGFFVALGVTFSAAAVGGWASANTPGFYAILNKPSWAPPAAVFGPIWTVLYLLMAIAAWLVWVGFAAVLNAVLWRLNPELL